MTTMTSEIAKQLRDPFPPEHIGKLPRITCGDCSKARGRCCDQHSKKKCDECGNYITERHLHLDYVGHADVTSRLIEADPEWTWQPLASDEHGLPLFDLDESGAPVGMWIRLSVAGVSRLGYGSCESGKSDAVKVLIGDAIRNAAMRFGVAVDLWAKGDRQDPTAENSMSTPAQASRQSPRKRTETPPAVSPEVVAARADLLQAAKECGRGSDPQTIATFYAEQMGKTVADSEVADIKGFVEKLRAEYAEQHGDKRANAAQAAGAPDVAA